MEISFIHMHILVHLHVNKTNFHMKGFTLGLTLQQRQKATRKSPIGIQKPRGQAGEFLTHIPRSTQLC